MASMNWSHSSGDRWRSVSGQIVDKPEASCIDLQGVGSAECEEIYIAASCRMEKHPPNIVWGKKEF
eukprot:6326727-Ditylum_brightwellii.AAC.2